VTGLATWLRFEPPRSAGVEAIVLDHEFKAGIDAYRSARPGLAGHRLAELVEWNRAHADQEMPYFRQERLEAALETEGLRAERYLEAAARARELSRGLGIDATVDQHRLDPLGAPTTAPAWVVDVVNGDRALGGSSQPSAMAGYPIVSVPAGFALGELPVGISIFGRAHSEGTLLRIASGFEALTRVRRAPRYLDRLELP